jgi:hypothetical protein
MMSATSGAGTAYPSGAPENEIIMVAMEINILYINNIICLSAL